MRPLRMVNEAEGSLGVVARGPGYGLGRDRNRQLTGMMDSAGRI